METQTEAEAIALVHKAFINFDLRAEKASEEMLIETFVDSEPLLAILSNTNNSITYGRRGTGKTHAFKFLENRVKSRSEVAIYIDLRSVGSNTSIYSDQSRSLSERSSQLINDVLQSILAALYPVAIERIEAVPHKDQLTLRLDDFQQAIGSVLIRGSTENTLEQSATDSDKANVKVDIGVSKGLSAMSSLAREASTGVSVSSKTKSSGIEIVHVDFGTVQTSLAGLIAVLGIPRMWLLIDEWSEVPLDLQPYLADLIRRTVLPIKTCVVKIAAIEHRSNFIIAGHKREYIGLELGADISANLNLDDFLVFEADEHKAVQFFKNLLYKHYKGSEHTIASISNADQLIQLAFTQNNVFSEFVRAVEGVPRDALNLATTIATKAYGNKISMTHVRTSARDWYQRDKAAVIRGNEPLSDTLTIILNEVIGNRKARAFLFPANIRNLYVEALFDARLLHILKKNISSRDEPGARYDVFKIDYGCYVDLINTNKEPLGLFQTDDDDKINYVEVPKDDYRSIRRAILKPEMLTLSLQKQAGAA